MKLSIFDRILLAILLIAAILFSFILFGVSANLIPEKATMGFIDLFYAYQQNALILAGSGAVLLLICVKLLFAGRGKKDRTKESAAPASTLMRQSEIGGMFISLDAIDAMVKKHCASQAEIQDCQTTIRAAEDGVTIGIRLAVPPDTEVITLTESLQQSLKAYIQGLTGINVKEIGILVENTAPQPIAVK